MFKYFLELLETTNMAGFGYAMEGEISACIMTHFLLDLYCVVYLFLKKEENEQKMSLKDLTECSALGPNTAKITPESFFIWKEKTRKDG